MPDEPLQYLEIQGWDRYLHPDTRRKCEPPFRWIKLQLDHLDALGDLTLREFGAFCRLLLLAATTDNRTIYKPGWIRRRSGVSRTAIESLLSRNLVRLVPCNSPDVETQLDQATSSQDASESLARRPQNARLEEEGRRLDKKPRRDINLDAPIPPRRNGEMRHASSLVSTAAGGGADRRSFDQLKEQLLPVAIRLNSKDPGELHRLAGQGLRMSRKQIDTAVHQLIEDGRL